MVRRLQIPWFILVLARKVTAMSRSSHFLLFALTTLSAFVVASAQPTRAATEIAGDLDVAVPIDSSFKSGGGFGFRLGNQIHLPMVVLTPELAFTYHDFSGGYSAATYRGVAGARPGHRRASEPGVFVHLGLGHLKADVLGFDPSHTGFTYDAGIFLDFTLLPVLNLGVHAAYNHLDGGDRMDPMAWATLGAHAELIF